MSTQRYVSTSFWDDEWVQSLDPSEKLLFLYYMTNPLTNICGIYKITVRRTSFDTGFTADTIGHIMAKFEKARKVVRSGEYIILPNWPKHQKADERPTIRTGIEKELAKLPEAVIRAAIGVSYQYPIIGYGYSPSYSDSDSDSDLDTDLDSENRDYAATQRAPSAPGTALEPIPDPEKPKPYAKVQRTRDGVFIAASLDYTDPRANEKALGEAADAFTDTVKTLEGNLWRRFLDIQPDKKFPRSSYAKERLGVKRIVAEAMARQPEAPEEWIAGYLAAWKRCHDRRDSCFKGQPFTPSVMGSGALMVRALEEMAKDRAAPSVDQEEIPW